MTQEQKAKAYDEAKARMSRAFNSNRCTIGFMNEIFPELESEDERIRKAIITYLKQRRDRSSSIPAAIGSWIAWLEKQDDRWKNKNLWKSADDEDLPEIDREVIVLTQPYPLDDSAFAVSFAHRPDPNGYDGKSISTGKTEHYTPETYDKGAWNIPNIKWWLDVEFPKLKKDSVFQNDIVEQKPTNKVKSKFKVGDWITNGFDCTFQIASIEDGIYYDTNDCGSDIESTDKDYRLWNIEDVNDGDILVYKTDEVEWIFIYREIVPAAQEVPHDLLRYYFLLEGNYSNWNGVSAMVTDDYKLYLKPATKEQCEQLEKAMANAGYTFDFEKKELKKIEQNPAWSEEDEAKLKSILFHIEDVENKDVIDWLKSLKDRVQPKQIMWSKEDEQYLLVCKNALVKYQTTDKWDANIISHWLEDKLKSLHHQKQWKPTEEQLKCLNKALGLFPDTEVGNYRHCVLEELLEQLKAL